MTPSASAPTNSTLVSLFSLIPNSFRSMPTHPAGALIDHGAEFWAALRAR
jgi:hypothetical protein